MATARPYVVVGGLTGVLAGSMVAVMGPLALAPLLVIAAGYAVVRLPGVVLAAYLLIPFYKGFAQPFVPVDLTAALAIANAASLGVGVLRQEPIAPNGRGMALWVALSALVVAGTLYAPPTAHEPVTGSTLIYWLALIAIPLLATVRVGSDRTYLRQFLWSVVVLGCVMIGLGLLALGESSTFTALGTNTLGASRVSLFVGVIAGAWALHSGGRRTFVAAAVLVPASVLVAASTGSRGPLLAFLVLGVGAVLLRVRSRRAWAFAIPAAVALVGTVALVGIPTEALGRYERLAIALSQDDPSAYVDHSAASRLFLYGEAIDRFAERPLFGFGTDAFAVYDGVVVHDYPHSLLLEFAADFGIVGVALAAAIIWHVVRHRRDGTKEWAAMSALILFILFNNVVGGSVFDDRLTWGLVAFGLLVPTAPIRKTEDHPPPHSQTVRYPLDRPAAHSPRPRG